MTTRVFKPGHIYEKLMEYVFGSLFFRIFSYNMRSDTKMFLNPESNDKSDQKILK